MDRKGLFPRYRTWTTLVSARKLPPGKEAEYMACLRLPQARFGPAGSPATAILLRGEGGGGPGPLHGRTAQSRGHCLHRQNAAGMAGISLLARVSSESNARAIRPVWSDALELHPFANPGGERPGGPSAPVQFMLGPV